MKLVRFLCIFLIMSILIPTISFAQTETKITLNSKAINLSQDVIIMNSRAYIPLRTLSENMGFFVDYDNNSKSVKLIRPDTNILLSLTNSHVVINGKTISNSEVPFVKKGVTYVPLRFIIENMGAAIKWDASTHVISITDKRFAIVSNNVDTYWVSFDTGNVYFMKNRVVQQLKDANVSPLSEGKLSLNHFKNNQVLLTVTEEYGANLLNFYNRYQFFIQDQSIMKQTYFTYTGMYITTQFQKAPPSNQPFLSDGNTLYLIDALGNISKQYPLDELTGTDGQFIIEYLTSEYILLRPVGSLQLICITLQNGKATMLYKKLFMEQESEFMDSAVPGDSVYLSYLLKFDKQEADTLFLHYTSPVTDKVKNVTYKFSVQE